VKLILWVRTSPWGPLVSRLLLVALGFFALASIGSGAAADLLPKKAGVYLGPAPSASGSAAAPTPTALPAADAGAAAEADAGAVTGVVPVAPAKPAPNPITADGKVILNLASEDDLRKLPGIGEKKAKAIVELRSKLGKFKRAEDLLRVKGIGRRKLARIREHLLIDPPPAS